MLVKTGWCDEEALSGEGGKDAYKRVSEKKLGAEGASSGMIFNSMGRKTWSELLIAGEIKPEVL